MRLVVVVLAVAAMLLGTSASAEQGRWETRLTLYSDQIDQAHWLIFDFVDESTGWLAASKLLRTRDGGLTWEAVSDLKPGALDFVSPLEGWAADEVCEGAQCVASVYHTLDGGGTWEKQTSHEGSLSRVVFVDEANGWVLLEFPRSILHTSDGGRTWREQPALGGQIDTVRMAFVNANVVWAASKELAPDTPIRVFVSEDGGDSWRPAGEIDDRDGCGPQTLSAGDANHAWVVSLDCRERVKPFINRTVNSGAYWERVPLGGIGEVRYTRFFDAVQGVMVRAVCSETEIDRPCEDFLLRTTDGGVTWSTEPTGLQGGYFYSFLFMDPWHGWRGETIGGGQEPIAMEILQSYVGVPPQEPVSMPTVGSGRGGSSTTVTTAVLAALGVALIAIGRVWEHRRNSCRRPRSWHNGSMRARR